MRVSGRVAGISLSTTLALDARAKELAAAGRDVVNMAVGEPDFAPPRVVVDATCAAAREGRTRYTPAAGTMALRRAIARHLGETRGVEFAPAEVTVCHSAKHALSGAVLALVDPGDEVLLLNPAWVSYVEQVRLAGGVPVAVEPRPDGGPNLEALRAACGPRTRGMMINSPSNPTGYVMEPAEVAALAALAEERDLWILSDEIYRRLVYEGPPNPSPVSLGPAARARTVIVDGASKSYAMTGYRIGYVAGPEAVAAGVARLHSHLTGCPNSVSQAAFEAALVAEPPEVELMCREFARRREVLLEGLERLGLAAPRPRGAFYVFPDVAHLLDERGSIGFCEDLLESHALALVPGTAFGAPRHVRLSYALGMDHLREALRRLEAFLAAR